MTGQNRSSQLASNQLASNQLTSKIQFSQTVVRRILNEQVAVLARNTGAEEALKDIASLAAGGNQSILCVPLLAHERSLAFFTCRYETLRRCSTKLIWKP